MSGVTLPTSVSTSSQWQLVDWRRARLSSAPAVGGVATIDVGQLPDGEMWLLDHMVAQCDSTAATVMRLYEDSPQPLNLLDGSNKGNFDVADWPGGLLVRSSTSLIAQWAGASDGAIATLTLQARVLRRS
jgi:hypothetical protein